MLFTRTVRFSWSLRGVWLQCWFFLWFRVLWFYCMFSFFIDLFLFSSAQFLVRLVFPLFSRFLMLFVCGKKLYLLLLIVHWQFLVGFYGFMVLWFRGRGVRVLSNQLLATVARGKLLPGGGSSPRVAPAAHKCRSSPPL